MVKAKQLTQQKVKDARTRSMTGNGSMTKCMETGATSSRQEPCTLASGSMGKCMESGKWSTQMALRMKENGQTTK